MLLILMCVLRLYGVRGAGCGVRGAGCGGEGTGNGCRGVALRPPDQNSEIYWATKHK